MFPSECTDLSGIVPGGPPRSLVMGVFPWKLNVIFLSHLLATANALSPQIRDRGLRNLPPLITAGGNQQCTRLWKAKAHMAAEVEEKGGGEDN